MTQEHRKISLTVKLTSNGSRWVDTLCLKCGCFYTLTRKQQIPGCLISHVWGSSSSSDFSFNKTNKTFTVLPRVCLFVCLFTWLRFGAGKQLAGVRRLPQVLAKLLCRSPAGDAKTHVLSDCWSGSTSAATKPHSHTRREALS